MKNVTQLKPRQITALQLLATGTPAYQVAARLEISTMTLYRWQQQPRPVTSQKGGAALARALALFPAAFYLFLLGGSYTLLV